ncbi:hypothetical protein BaRGS_00038197, partial [Batillaria attramentaria]
VVKCESQGNRMASTSSAPSTSYSLAVLPSDRIPPRRNSTALPRDKKMLPSNSATSPSNTTADIDVDLDEVLAHGDPEAVLDVLAMRSHRMRYSDEEVSPTPVPAFPSDDDLELFVRDFAIDDAISDCFADMFSASEEVAAELPANSEAAPKYAKGSKDPQKTKSRGLLSSFWARGVKDRGAQRSTGQGQQKDMPLTLTGKDLGQSVHSDKPSTSYATSTKNPTSSPNKSKQPSTAQKKRRLAGAGVTPLESRLSRGGKVTGNKIFVAKQPEVMTRPVTSSRDELTETVTEQHVTAVTSEAEQELPAADVSSSKENMTSAEGLFSSQTTQSTQTSETVERLEQGRQLVMNCLASAITQLSDLTSRPTADPAFLSVLSELERAMLEVDCQSKWLQQLRTYGDTTSVTSAANVTKSDADPSVEQDSNFRLAFALDTMSEKKTEHRKGAYSDDAKTSGKEDRKPRVLPLASPPTSLDGGNPDLAPTDHKNAAAATAEHDKNASSTLDKVPQTDDHSHWMTKENDDVSCVASHDSRISAFDSDVTPTEQGAESFSEVTSLITSSFDVSTADADLRHERLQRHLTALIQQTAQPALTMETVVTATGERLSCQERLHVEHVNQGTMYPFSTRRETQHQVLAGVSAAASAGMETPAAEHRMNSAHAVSSEDRSFGAGRTELGTARSAGHAGRLAHVTHKGGSARRLFSPDRQVSLVSARQMTSREFQESYDRTYDAGKAKRSQLDGDIPWDMLQFSDTDDEASTCRA